MQPKSRMQVESNLVCIHEDARTLLTLAHRSLIFLQSVGQSALRRVNLGGPGSCETPGRTGKQDVLGMAGGRRGKRTTYFCCLRPMRSEGGLVASGVPHSLGCGEETGRYLDGSAHATPERPEEPRSGPVAPAQAPNGTRSQEVTGQPGLR